MMKAEAALGFIELTRHLQHGRPQEHFEASEHDVRRPTKDSGTLRIAQLVQRVPFV